MKRHVVSITTYKEWPHSFEPSVVYFPLVEKISRIQYIFICSVLSCLFSLISLFVLFCSFIFLSFFGYAWIVLNFDGENNHGHKSLALLLQSCKTFSFRIFFHNFYFFSKYSTAIFESSYSMSTSDEQISLPSLVLKL